jgi:hypothetical protein
LNEEGINDLLDKELVEKEPIVHIIVQCNDVSVNLVVGVISVELFCPKSHVFQELLALSIVATI